MATTSQPRTDLEGNVCHRFLQFFDGDIGDEEHRLEFIALLDDNVEWFDHAFQAFHPTTDGAVLEVLWLGCQKNDIVRPDGAVAVKASGKDFKCHVCMVMVINNVNKIARIDEYYHKSWDEGVSQDQYVRMRGASLKS